MAATASKTLSQIRKALNHFAMDWEPSLWLNTGIPGLNAVLGHAEKGIPYGRVIEISGWESQGKTAIMMALAALAQQDGARVIWGDLENSFDADWARQRGLNPDEVLLIQPYVGRFNGERTPRLSTAQELCVEIEHCMTMRTVKGAVKRVVVLDSIPSLLTEGEAAAGVDGANLRTNMDLPMFLGRLLRRWVALAQAQSCLIVLINQLRTNPMARFARDYTPGGNAPRFYSHVRVRVSRIKGGRIKDKGKLVGIQGIMRCLKNKTGGSEGAEIGYRLLFKGPLEFLEAKKIRKEVDGAEENDA